MEKHIHRVEKECGCWSETIMSSDGDASASSGLCHEHQVKNSPEPLTRNLTTEEASDYWKKAEETAKIVASWPAWKRNIQIGKIGAENNPSVKVRSE